MNVPVRLDFPMKTDNAEEFRKTMEKYRYWAFQVNPDIKDAKETWRGQVLVDKSRPLLLFCQVMPGLPAFRHSS